MVKPVPAAKARSSRAAKGTAGAVEAEVSTPHAPSPPVPAAQSLRNMLLSDPHKEAVDDLFEEAQHWLDGSAISTPQEAEGVEKLLDLARKAHTAADLDRKVEAKPFDDGKAEVQARYNPILARATRIADACRAVLRPWREAIEAEKRREAMRAQLLADEQRRLADEASRKANESGDIRARDIADAKLSEAKKQEKFATKLGRQAETGNKMRTYWEAKLVDRKAALTHYNRLYPEKLDAFVLELAQDEARHGKRTIPGFEITEKKVPI